jgi:hypothetical protein
MVVLFLVSLQDSIYATVLELKIQVNSTQPLYCQKFLAMKVMDERCDIAKLNQPATTKEPKLRESVM